MLTNSFKYRQFFGKNFLALDYGTKKIGTSLYSVGREPWPFPFEKIQRQNDRMAIERIAAIVREEGIDHIVLGLPLLLDGRISSMTEKVQRFGRKLGLQLKMNIFYQDETLSSKEAESRMKNSPRYNFRVDPEQTDCLCASIILEDFFLS